MYLLLFASRKKGDRLQDKKSPPSAVSQPSIYLSPILLSIFILAKTCPPQAIKAAYEQNHGMSLMKAVNKGCSGTYKKCLLACLFPSIEVWQAIGTVVRGIVSTEAGLEFPWKIADKEGV